MVVQELGGFNLLPCTSLPRHPAVCTCKPPPSPLGLGKRSCIPHGLGAAITRVSWCWLLMHEMIAEFKCRMRKEWQEGIFLSQIQGLRPLLPQGGEKLCQVPLGAGGCPGPLSSAVPTASSPRGSPSPANTGNSATHPNLAAACALRGSRGRWEAQTSL